MTTSPIGKLGRLGQSLWYDNISRPIIREGGLAAMVAEGIGGVTSNPTIFMKAIAEGHAYDEDVRRLAAEGKSAGEVVRELMAGDIREAADVLRPVWEASGGVDGYVSLECNPHLADDTDATVPEALRLRDEVDRPNLMVKVPGTAAGAPAVRELLRRGVNVNVTLLFSPAHYRRVALAYLEALEDRLAEGLPVAGVHSVASFFISRIDTAVDRRLDALAAEGVEAAAAGRLRGETAVAVAKVTYGIFRELFFSGRFDRLRERGAAIQRPLWASTGTKDPAYSDLKYVETLVGPHTVNTVPQATLDAFRDHGSPSETVTAGLDEAPGVLAEVGSLGIDLERVYDDLQRDGVRAFADSWDQLVAAVGRKMVG